MKFLPHKIELKTSEDVRKSAKLGHHKLPIKKLNMLCDTYKTKCTTSHCTILTENISQMTIHPTMQCRLQLPNVSNVNAVTWRPTKKKPYIAISFRDRRFESVKAQYVFLTEAHLLHQSGGN